MIKSSSSTEINHILLYFVEKDLLENSEHSFGIYSTSLFVQFKSTHPDALGHLDDHVALRFSNNVHRLSKDEQHCDQERKRFKACVDVHPQLSSAYGSQPSILNHIRLKSELSINFLTSFDECSITIRGRKIFR